MIVTFVGGPLNGTHETREDVPQLVTVDGEGGPFVYELRQQSGGSTGNRPIEWQHSTYAPKGISMIEFFELSRAVPPPVHLFL
ncbi:hypothetical protein ABB29_04030 [Pseudoxanthomonas dokdonensis]|uniref:Uncharacterized protein n=1 Tax=Pseudoxanthomonas dokdonensis TaxID=344882 RepID=A0A0R0CX83_9GAMM|nr:hypothetical protein ABB29_04030 [Pseudoxanthomonas dokdonensis]